MPNFGKKRKNPVRHKAPSRVRYEVSHPVVSFRTTREAYQRLKDVLDKSGRSVGGFFREALAIQKTDTERIYQRGFRAGYEEARRLYLVAYSCTVCGQRLEVNSAEEKAAAARYMVEHGWGHRSCHENRRSGAV